MIPEKFIEEIQARVDIVEIISGYFPLKKSGRNFKACCPFHSEKTPSFVVSPQKQIFHCFGCGQGGGVFQFLMQTEKINFPEAVEMLAKKIGKTIPYAKSGEGKLKNSCYEATEEASLFYHNVLKAKDQAVVLRYLRGRGIADKTIDAFRLGFAPGRNSLINYMRKKGFTLGTLEKSSLITSGGENFRDTFCDRVLFPIFDIRGRVIGFGGRIWKPAEKAPKYINSGESSIYSKRKALFGLNLAKKEIIKKGCVYVVEGYLDMIIPFMRGVENIVASLGTSLTQEQIKLLSRFCSKVVLVFDSDRAGENAMLRTIDLLLENQMQIQVVELPAGEDPDSIVRKKGKDCFLKMLNQPLDFFDFKLKILKKQFNLEGIEGKSKIAASMLSTLSKIEDQVKIYQYLAKLSEEINVKEEAIISEYKRNFLFKSKFKGKVDSYQQAGKDSLGPEISVTEKILMKSIFTNPKIFNLIRKNFKVCDFDHPLVRQTVSFLFNQHLTKDKAAQDVLAGIGDKVVSGFVSRILLEEGIPQDQESLRRSLIKLRKKHIQEEKQKIKGEIKKADSEGDKEKLEKLIAQYNKVSSEVKDE